MTGTGRLGPGKPHGGNGVTTSRDAAAGGVLRSGTATLLYVTAVLFCISFWTVTILVPLYAVRLGYTLTGVGLLAAVPGLLQFGTRIVSGALSDAWGEVHVIRGCCALVLLSPLPLLSAHPALAALVTAQLLGGAGRGLFWSSAQAYASRLPVDRTTAMGRIASTTLVGSTVALLAAGALTQDAGYRVAFGIAAVLGAAALATSALLPLGRAPGWRHSASQMVGGFLSLLRGRILWLAGLCAFAAAIPNALTTSFFAVYGLHLGLAAAAATAVTALRNAGGLTGTNSFAALRARIGNRFALILSLTLLVGSLALAPEARGVWSYALAVGLAGLGGGLVNVLYLWLAARASGPEERGRAMALVGSFWALSMLITPALFGFVADRAGFGAAFWTVAGIALCAGTVVLLAGGSLTGTGPAATKSAAAPAD